MEASARPALRVIDGTNHEQVARDIKRGILIIDPKHGQVAADAADTIVGLLRTIESLGKTVGSLERKIKEEADPTLRANAEAKAVCERWKEATGKTKAVIGKSRIKMVNARAGEGYAYTSDDWLPDHITLELAVDGLASHPYRVYDKRFATGRKADLDNDLDACMKDEKHVERCARLGYAARKAGWTLEEGWPEGEES